MPIEGILSAKIRVSVVELLEMDALTFLDFLSEEMVGTTDLEIVDFEAVDAEKGVVVFYVKGDVSRLLAE